MQKVYSAVNHLQGTRWQINTPVLDVFKSLWNEGQAIAELPNREDEAIPPYPFPEKQKGDTLSEEQQKVERIWKREAYEIHKRNIQKRSMRILVAQILRIAEQFKGYEAIYFPCQLDFRGRIYPIPVLLNFQGNDIPIYISIAHVTYVRSTSQSFPTTIVFPCYADANEMLFFATQKRALISLQQRITYCM